MAELDRTEQFSNSTYRVSYYFPCTGSELPKAVRMTSDSLIMLFSLIGNLFIVAVFSRNKSLRTPVHYFIVNMAISDLIYPLIVLPWQITETYHNHVWLVDGVLGSVLCKLVRVAWNVTNTVSILSMVAIAVDRFHSVLLANKAPLFSLKVRRLTIVVIWICSVTLWAHYFYALRFVRHDTQLYCDFQWGSPSDRREMHGATLITFVSLSYLSAFVVTVLYASIAISLYKQMHTLQLASEMIRNRVIRNRRITLMLVIVVGVFYAESLPFNMMVIVVFFKPNIRLPCNFIWFSDYFLPRMHPVLNTIIYYVFNEEYRRSFRELLCCPRPCSNKCNYCLHFRTENIELQGQ